MKGKPMYIKDVNAEEFVRKIKLLNKLYRKNSRKIPNYQYIMLRAGKFENYIYYFNQYNGVKIDIGGVNSIEKEREIYLPFHEFITTVKKIPKENRLNLKLEGNRLRFRTNLIDLFCSVEIEKEKLEILEDTYYKMKIPPYIKAPDHEIKGQAFKKVLRSVQKFTRDWGCHDYLSGVHINYDREVDPSHLNFIATNGHFLRYAKLQGESPVNVGEEEDLYVDDFDRNITSNFVKFLIGYLLNKDIVWLSHDKVLFPTITGDEKEIHYVFYVRVGNDIFANFYEKKKYADWGTVIPENPSDKIAEIIFNRLKFKKRIMLLRKAVKKESKPYSKFIFTDSYMKITVLDSHKQIKLAESQQECKIKKGKEDFPFTFLFDLNYIYEILKSFKDKEIKLTFFTNTLEKVSQSPVFFLPVEETLKDYSNLCVLMPKLEDN
jgi:DNA polymerase III sliding clamp (beta) subunit (PCNA family)